MRSGLRWRDAPAVSGPHKTLHNRFARRSRLGVFAGIFRDLARLGAEGDTLMIDSTPPKAHPTAASLETKGDPPSRDRPRPQGGPELQAAQGRRRTRPLTFFLSPGQMSDARGALVLLAELPRAKRLLGGKGYDADWLRDELKARGVRARPPARNGRNRPASHTRKLHKTRNAIENPFARLKDWRALAMRYTRCGNLFLSAMALAAAVIFWPTL